MCILCKTAFVFSVLGPESVPVLCYKTVFQVLFSSHTRTQTHTHTH